MCLYLCEMYQCGGWWHCMNSAYSLATPFFLMSFPSSFERRSGPDQIKIVQWSQSHLRLYHEYFRVNTWGKWENKGCTRKTRHTCRIYAVVTEGRSTEAIMQTTLASWSLNAITYASAFSELVIASNSSLGFYLKWVHQYHNDL